MKVINLTPHPIRVGDRDFPVSGQVARVREIVVPDGEIDGLPVVRTSWGQIDGLPPPDGGETIFIVSPIILSAVPGRSDLVAPDTGPESVVRDVAGRIIGVRRLRRIGGVA